MGYHPNDPAVSPYLGSAQIMINPAAYRRSLLHRRQPLQRRLILPGELQVDEIRAGPRASIRWLPNSLRGRKIQFVHFRDVEGTADTRYHETFHDSGPTDMARMLQCYARGGFVGPLRTDHAPAMEGEDSQRRPGYAMLGHIFALGVHHRHDAGTEYSL